jgi:hypothetical protein
MFFNTVPEREGTVWYLALCGMCEYQCPKDSMPLYEQIFQEQRIKKNTKLIPTVTFLNI